MHGECTEWRHIKASVGQAVRLKQDVPLFLASIWNSVSSRAGPWLLRSANGECAQADKAEGICSTFHRPFKQHRESQNARLWVRWFGRQSYYGPRQLHLSRGHVDTLHDCPAELYLKLISWSCCQVVFFPVEIKSSNRLSVRYSHQGFVITFPLWQRLLCENQFNTITLTCKGAFLCCSKCQVPSCLSSIEMSEIIALTCKITTNTAVFTVRFVKLLGI